MPKKTNLTEFLEALNQAVESGHISLGDIVQAFEQRGFGPLLLAPALIVLLPTGAIPGVPTVCALFICLVDGQLLLGRRYPWLPKKLRTFSIGRDKFQSAVKKAKPITKRIDYVIRSRLTGFIEPPASYIIAVLSIFLALTMIPLELVPFAAAAPAAAIAFFALGLTAKDGLLVIVGLVVTAITAAGVIWGF